MFSNETNAATPRKSISRASGTAATAAVGVAFALAGLCAPSLANELAPPTEPPRQTLFALIDNVKAQGKRVSSVPQQQSSSVPKQPQAPRAPDSTQ